MGSRSDVRSNVVTAVLTIGPGDSMMLRQKTPKITMSSHCPSLTDHRCACNALKVSAGENEVCREARELAGDWRFLNLLRSLRRNLCGTNICSDFHGICTVVFDGE